MAELWHMAGKPKDWAKSGIKYVGWYGMFMASQKIE